MSKKTEPASAAPNDESATLVEGIKAEADEKIKAARADAMEYSEKRLNAARAKAEAFRAEARVAAEVRKATVLAAAESRLSIDTNRSALASEERYMKRALELAASEFSAAVGKPGYAERLEGWILEAAIGLSAPEAIIIASEADRPLIDDAMLRKAEAGVKELAGVSTRLRLSDGEPLKAQGVVLEAEGGRIAYDNSAPVRLARAEAAMRAVVRAALAAATDSSTGTPGSKARKSSTGEK